MLSRSSKDEIARGALLKKAAPRNPCHKTFQDFSSRGRPLRAPIVFHAVHNDLSIPARASHMAEDGIAPL